MKETRELQTATEARDAARVAMTATTRKLRNRLSPRMLAADVAEMVATRAGGIVLKSGISRRKRVTAAIGGAAAIASAIALRASARLRAKKSGDFPSD